MTVASQFISDAMRENNIIGVGESPTSAETTEHLRRLNGLINYWIGTACGELVHDWYIPNIDNTAPFAEEDPRDPLGDNQPSQVYIQPPQNSRLVTKITAATTVYLPEYPSDGARIELADAGSTSTSLTLDANGRKIEDAATLAIDPTSVTTRKWFFRADQANWVRLADLASADTPPFPAEYDRMITTGLNIVLSPTYGKEPAAVTVATFNEMYARFKMRYKQYTPTETQLSMRATQSFRLFDRGSLAEFQAGV